MVRTGVLQEIRMLRFEDIHDRFCRGSLSSSEAAEWLGSGVLTRARAQHPTKRLDDAASLDAVAAVPSH